MLRASRSLTIGIGLLLATSLGCAPAPGGGADGAAVERSLVIYSGRSESLVGPLLESLERETGIQVDVRYGGTSELAATILEEGENSPADLFLSQDAAALGALSQEGATEDLAGGASRCGSLAVSIES